MFRILQAYVSDITFRINLNEFRISFRISKKLFRICYDALPYLITYLAVTSCPFIPTPRNGTKTYQTEQENTLVGAHIVFGCEEGLTLTGPEERICQENGDWTGEGDNDCVGKLSRYCMLWQF